MWTSSQPRRASRQQPFGHREPPLGHGDGVMSALIVRSTAQQPACARARLDVVRARDVKVFQSGENGGGVCGAVTIFIGAFKRLEGVLGDAGRDVGRDVTARIRLIHHHQTTGLLHALDDGVVIQRRRGAQIDHVAADPSFSSLSATSLASFTMRPSVTMVTSSPSRVRFASPKGMV